jgi:hypothetical protein
MGGVNGSGGRAPVGGSGRRDAGADTGTPRDAASARDDAGRDASAADALILRYDFSGEGTLVIDRAGNFDGHVLGGATLDGEGGVVLDGKDDYVDMPNHLLSPLTDVTLVSWLQWSGDFCWERIFDFGNNDHGEDEIGSGAISLFLTAAACSDSCPLARAEFTSSAYEVHMPNRLPIDRSVQTAFVLDANRGIFALYVDGQQVAQARAGFELRWIDDINNWLGRSQWVQDRNMHGRYDEFRIYAAALSAEDIADLYERGPDDP